MYGEVHEIPALEHGERLQVELDHSLPRDRAEVHALEAGVRPIGGKAPVVVYAEPEDGVLHRFLSQVGDSYLERLTRIELGRRLALAVQQFHTGNHTPEVSALPACLLYTSDAADDLLC